ncbi:MAG: GNAT family N-acetyltransferase [Bacteroidia bacterium]|nr:GNAT family N-acetyltransferase [Bacteroidia bacterium]
MHLSVREIQESDIPQIVSYFIDADEDFLLGMGADKNKLPERSVLSNKIAADLDLPYNQKKIYYIIWEVNGEAIGHSNINNIEFGKTANMHLHIWQPDVRQSGFGSRFLKKTIPYYFKNFDLEYLICEPYAHNPAPNRILKKIGFRFIKKYETIPGSINFYQEVNRYEIDKVNFEKTINRIS